MTSIPSYTQKISEEAGAWLARLHASDLSAEDEIAFRSWLAANPAHAAAFEHATNIWDRLGGVPRDQYISEKSAPRILSRRALVAGGVGLAIFGATVPYLRKAQAQNYQTAIGEQTRVPLVDGSELFLDTNTSLNVDFSGDRRLVNLQYGRVDCRIAQSDRQFAVKTGDCLVVGNRSVFDVSNSGTAYSVVLIDGSAQVGSPASGPIELRQGDRATAAYSKPFHRDKPDLSLITAWQTGRLIFRDETVSDAIGDVNRYSTIKIEIDDPSIAALRISGGYAIGDSLGFVASLSQLLPVEARRSGGKVILIGRSTI